MTYSGRTALRFKKAPHVVSICLHPEEGRSTYLCNLSVATKLRRVLSRKTTFLVSSVE